jgi:hypothetical protein
MKFVALFIGILVIISWILVIKDSKNNGQKKTEKSQNIMLIACLLTLIMTILQIFY